LSHFFSTEETKDRNPFASVTKTRKTINWQKYAKKFLILLIATPDVFSTFVEKRLGEISNFLDRPATDESRYIHLA
jgi:hypothetical protein